MNQQVHILNGDALLEQFSADIPGEVIVARECLIEGDIQGDNLDDFFASRARYISKIYDDTEKDYHKKVASELRKITAIAVDQEANLWFEDDLFCQVNFWFVLDLLNKNGKGNACFLVRPKEHNQYGFGGLNNNELEEAFQNRLPLTEVEKIASLWDFYKKENVDALLSTAKGLEPKYPFILSAVNAHIERIPAEGNAGRPKESLSAIMKELRTKEFGKVFQEFCRRESVYGFGDVQVKRMYDEIVGGL